MSVLFYRRDGAGEPPASAGLAGDLTLRIWRPARDGLPPPGRERLQNLAWWTFGVLGVFAGPGFAELTVWREGEMLHRLIVTPRWRRFPFMGRDDLQVGALWTHPDARGRGIAGAALAEAHRQLIGPAGRVWYVVDDDNTASVRVAEAGGYRPVGVGLRTRPFGVAAFGQFRMETEAG